jgi:hypothetical protein
MKRTRAAAPTALLALAALVIPVAASSEAPAHARAPDGHAVQS